MKRKKPDTNGRAFSGRSGYHLARGLIQLAKTNAALALRLACDFAGVPTKTQNRADRKNLSLRPMRFGSTDRER